MNKPTLQADSFQNPTLRDMCRKVKLLSVLAVQYQYREARTFLRALREYLAELPLER